MNSKPEESLFMSQSKGERALDNGVDVLALLVLEYIEMKEYDEVSRFMKPLLVEFANVFPKKNTSCSVLPTPNQSWEDLSMCFIVSFPRTQKGKDSITMVVDRFLINTLHSMPKTDDVSIITTLFYSRK